MADTMVVPIVAVDAAKPDMAVDQPAHMASRPAKRVVGGFVDSDDEEEDGDNSNMTDSHTTAAVQHIPEVDLTAIPPSSTAAETCPTADGGLQDAQAVVEENEEDRYDLLFSAGSQLQAQLQSQPLDIRPRLRSLSPPPPPPASTIVVQTCTGRAIPVRQRTRRHAAPAIVPYQELVAQRSRTKEGRAQRSYFGIAIHELVDGAQKEMAEARARAEKERKAKEEAEAAAAAAAEAEALAAVAAAAAEAEAEEEDGLAHKGKERAAKAPPPPTRRPKKTMLWTEKYRARNFMDLVGDDLTNRIVLRWLKQWDPIVFPGSKRAVPMRPARPPPSSGPGAPPNNNNNNNNTDAEEKPHRKILILTGPPGLGKTTLAHVCARQAGYEVLEINASDDRSRDVVNGRIRTSLGTESVKVNTVAASSSSSKKTQGRPVCVVVDEVDGVVGGSSGSGGEGGFVKALIDLVHLDQKNSSNHHVSTATQPGTTRSKKRGRGDDFRQMRPLVLICNDVYHAALRPLRLSGLAEIVHVGKPSVDAVVVRLKSIFEKEGIACEKEAARKLCEAAWGMSTAAHTRRGAADNSSAEGDLRGVMVVGEWVARRLRATAAATAATPTTGKVAGPPQLTRFWVEKHVLPDLSYGGGTSGGGGGGGGGLGARGMGRGGVREIVSRVFQEGAGFPKTSLSSSASSSSASSSATRSYRHEQPKEQMSFAEHQQRASMARLREMIETSGDVDRIMTDVFSEWPVREFNDDSYLSKPDAAYEWMHFHDACARRVFGSQEWELAAYTSQPVLACHALFASPKRHQPDDDADMTGDGTHRPSPFSGPRADFAAREAEKLNRAALQALQAQLPPSLLRAFRNAEDLAADFLPYAVRLVSPDVKPVLVNVANTDKNAKGPTAVASVRREGEKVLVRRAAEVLAELGIKMQRGILEDAGAAAVPGRPQWVYRMEPDLDMLASFETASGLILSGNSAPTRYAVRQVLSQELRKTLAARDSAARQARFQAGTPLGAAFAAADAAAAAAAATGAGAKDGGRGSALKRKAAEDVVVKRDFFGRVVAVVTTARDVDGDGDGAGEAAKAAKAKAAGEPVWVTYHEGLNNAVRKPISVDEFLRGL